MKINPIYLLCTLLLAACDTDTETIDQRTLGPREQNPAEYASYLSALRSYKSSEHFLTYARLANAPEVSTSPRDFMRALPDSLDLIALERPLSSFDREDLPEVQAKGTRVLMTADCSDPAGAAAAVDAALAQMAAAGLDGVTVSFTGPATDAAKAAAASVTTRLAAYPGKTFVFSGNLALLTPADRERYTLFVMDATEIKKISELRDLVAFMTDYQGFPRKKLLLSAIPSATIEDDSRHAQPAVPLTAKYLLSDGTLAGLAVFSVGDDYYDAAGNYLQTRAAINVLNFQPAK